MKGTLRSLSYVLLALVCILPVATLLLTGAHRELEQALTCILSTEVVAPVLIFSLASLVYLVRKAESA
jgi:hypothetical protein